MVNYLNTVITFYFFVLFLVVTMFVTFFLVLFYLGADDTLNPEEFCTMFYLLHILKFVPL